MKTADQVSRNNRPAFFAMLYDSMREAALECGYALALHGSMSNDMDILAVPWVEECEPYEVLKDKIHACIGSTMWQCEENLQPTEKPHNRIAYSIVIYGDVYIDLSIVKPISKKKKVEHKCSNYENTLYPATDLCDNCGQRKAKHDI